jgi:hypothetical protein
MVHQTGLTNRWSQPLAAVKSTFDFMKQFRVFATLAAASSGSARSRYGYRLNLAAFFSSKAIDFEERRPVNSKPTIRSSRIITASKASMSDGRLWRFA